MIEPEHNPQSTSDADLVLRTRSGDAEAFGELWSRHYRSGITVARSMTSSIDPDDLVQEAYARIFQAIQKGAGPNGSFRAYLFTSIRNTAAAWGRASREATIDEIDVLPDPATTEQATDEALDRSLTAQAFRSLPSRWQEVLWYTEIEQMRPAEVAPLLGMSSGAVAQLAFRAREGLREAWIQAHLSSAPDGSECHRAITALGAYARGNLSRREQGRLEGHLENCTRCFIVAAEAKDVSQRLALVMLPLVVGVGAAGSYLAALQAGQVQAVALASLPEGLIDNGMLLAASSGASGGAGGTAGGVSSGGAAGGGALSGAGMVIGASAAAVVIAGVVAAASILPALSGDTASGALAQSESLSLSTLDAAEVEADPDIEPQLTPYDDAAPEETPDDTVDPAPAPFEPEEEPPATRPTTPPDSGDGGSSGSPSPEAPSEPEESEKPSGPGDGEESGGVDEEPGDDAPGEPDENEGTGDGGDGEGTTEPGDGDTGDPGDAEGSVYTAVTPGAASPSAEGSELFDIPITGTPGERVEARYQSLLYVESAATALDESGTGVLTLKIRQVQIQSGDWTVTFSYPDTEDAPTTTKTFSELGIAPV